VPPNAVGHSIPAIYRYLRPARWLTHIALALGAGVQIESQVEGVRDTPANRAAFANAMVSPLASFLGLRNE